jgi:hypothetical protein
MEAPWSLAVPKDAVWLADVIRWTAKGTSSASRVKASSDPDADG